MYTLGNASKEKYETLHKDLKLIIDNVLKVYDISIVEGTRTLELQQKYFKEGKSKLDGINKKSKHQSLPSMAVDIIPYKQGTNPYSGNAKDTYRFYYLAGLFKGIANKLLEEGKITHSIIWGGDWNSNDVYTDNSFDDLPHFELKEI